MLVEVLKYSSKIFTETEKPEKNGVKPSRFVYVSALDNIIWAMKGLRIFDRFGLDLPKKDAAPKGGKTSLAFDFTKWEYDLHQLDWISEETEEKLTDYKPSPELATLLEYAFIDEME